MLVSRVRLEPKVLSFARIEADFRFIEILQLFFVLVEQHFHPAVT